ncbi:hypothetical protein BD408DRAFT_423136 [Parasitella parasitica]|nr:hypothetical protein BD408DRAFT_423136 [Parasitella parasitica]
MSELLEIILRIMLALLLLQKSSILLMPLLHTRISLQFHLIIPKSPLAIDPDDFPQYDQTPDCTASNDVADNAGDAAFKQSGVASVDDAANNIDDVSMATATTGLRDDDTLSIVPELEQPFELTTAYRTSATVSESVPAIHDSRDIDLIRSGRFEVFDHMFVDTTDTSNKQAERGARSNTKIAAMHPMTIVKEQDKKFGQHVVPSNFGTPVFAITDAAAGTSNPNTSGGSVSSSDKDNSPSVFANADKSSAPSYIEEETQAASSLLLCQSEKLGDLYPSKELASLRQLNHPAY